MRGYTLLFLLGYVASCAAISCTDGAIEHNGKCYQLHTETKNFNDAEATCIAANGHLVTVDTADKQQFAKSQMESNSVVDMLLGAKVTKTDWRWVKSGNPLKYQGCFSDNNDARLNIFVSSNVDNTPDSCITACRSRNHKYAGVKRDNSDSNKVVCRCGEQYNPDTYLTDCNTKCSDTIQKCGEVNKMRIYSVDGVGVTGWKHQQPNNYNNGYQTCLALHKGDPYKWGDEKCNVEGFKYGYLCEYDPPQSGCNAHAGRCYTTHSSSVSWYKAREECNTRGGDLLQVDTKELFDYFNGGSSPLDSNVERWWIGGSRVRWQWPGGVEMSYTNWASDQPNAESDSCVIIGQDVGSGFQWSDKSCTNAYAFMCQLGEVATTTTTTTTTTTPAPTTTTTPTTTTATTTTTTERTTTTKPTTTKKTTTTTKPTTTKKTTTKATMTTTKAMPKPATTKTLPKPATTKTMPKPATTKAMPKPATTKAMPKPATTTPKPGTVTTAEGQHDMTTEEDNVNGTTTANPKPGKQKDDEKKIFTTGVIIAITVAAVFVLLAFIRVMIYCCRSSDSDSKPFAEG